MTPSKFYKNFIHDLDFNMHINCGIYFSGKGTRVTHVSYTFESLKYVLSWIIKDNREGDNIIRILRKKIKI